jgi:nitrilase
MKVAAIQMVSATRVPPNLEAARRLLIEAAEQGAELVVLPEYFCLLGQRETDKLSVQEQFGDGPIQNMLARAAQELGLWVVGGTLPLSTHAPAKVNNASLVWSPAGECVARYDKIHLFRFDNGQERFDESRVLQAGHEPVQIAVPSRDGHTWQVRLSICYDLRFPELYRTPTATPGELLLVPSAFTYTTGQAHWELLLRARAVENLAFVAAAAQGGLHENGRQTWGHSMIVDPWGQVLAEQAQGEAVVLADLQIERLLSVRQQLPALDHRLL